MSPRAWILALCLLAGCTEDVDGVPTGVAATPGRSAAPLASPAGQAVATPAPLPPLVARPTPTPVVQATRQVPPPPTPPAPATPGPPGPTPTLLPTPTPAPSGATPLGFVPLDFLEAPGGMLYHPATMRLRTADEAKGFLARALGQPFGVVANVDYGTQEVLAFYDPGSADPLAPCDPPRLDKLYDYGSVIGYFMQLPLILDGCGSDERPAGYELVRIQRTEKPIDGIPEYAP